jgi:F420-0:gamma-glutamyl ligase-like protein
VVSFGGDAEITLSDTDADRRIAGVVSTQPAYSMNSGLQSEFTVMVALTGRVPCSVVGSVRKGDMMVAAGNGQARAEANPAVGTVIGKALEDFDGDSGVIEVVVGRL